MPFAHRRSVLASALLSSLALAAPACTVRMELPPGEDGGAGDGPGLDARRDAGGCVADRDCTDRIACSIDRCVSGACTHAPCVDCCPADLACDTALGCTTPPVPCTVDGECSDGIRCTLDSCGTSGFCERRPEPGLCEAGEVCLAGVGCIPTPPTSCTGVEECRAGSLCAADWLCEPEFGCTFVAPLDCDDADECTVDGCDDTAGGCTHTPVDVDMDGHAPSACTGGDDCDDADPDRSPDVTEICNGSDDDCDATVDEGCCVPGPCTTSCGTAGTMACNPDGTPTACMPPAEACNGSDDNCDGTIDEGCCTSGPCTTSCGTTGVRGCNPDGTPGACAAPAETCNDVDDDCDGTVDDGFACRVGMTTACTTGCGSTGTRGCLAGCTLDSVCVPPVEICNGMDDDCDGSVDDGFTCAAGSTRTCTTSCGSSGTQTCSGACGLGACVAPAETCNGVDDDCDGTIDDGFACRLGSSTACTTGCGSTGTRACLPGCMVDSVCAPPAETCNGIDDNCNTTVDEGFSCAAGSTRDCTLLGFFDGDAVCRADCSGFDTATCTNCGNGTLQSGESCDGAALGGATCSSRGYFGGMLRCAAGCAFDESGCTNCGNNTIQSGESCDGTALGGATCTSRGYATGTLRCGSTCAYDESMCSNCGNGVVNAPEACDGAALGGATCASLGYGGGTLACLPGCTFNTSGCTSCGNGVINAGEDCDGANLGGNTCTSVPGGFSGGTLGCTAACRFSTAACTAPWNPSGTYLASPTVSYSCAFGLVNYSIPQFGFTDNGTTLLVTGANCGPSPGMTGAAVSRTTPRSFDVTCTYAGSCSETYRLTGTFDTDNHWNGTFRRSFSGSCFDCAAGMTAVSGMR